MGRRGEPIELGEPVLQTRCMGRTGRYYTVVLTVDCHPNPIILMDLVILLHRESHPSQ